jgi:hypothetical protein
MNPVTLAWLSEVGIITWRSVKNKSRPPLPSELLATFIAFGSLTLIANNPTAAKPANLVAWGLVVATMLNFFDPATGKPYGATNPKPGASTAGIVPQNPASVANQKGK